MPMYKPFKAELTAKGLERAAQETFRVYRWVVARRQL